MKKTALLILALPLALWGRKPATKNFLPETARPEFQTAAAKAAAKPHPRLFADAAGFEAL